MSAQDAMRLVGGTRMTPDHIRVLLGTLSALDTRLAAKDEGNANIRVNAWASLLAEVDPAYAMRYAQQAYQQVRDWPLQPAEILQGWRADQAATEAASDQDHRTTDAGQRPAGPSKMHGWIRDVWAAVSAGRSWESVPVPEGAVFQRTAEQESRERRCAFWRICACDHQRCRDGWSDDEALIVGVNGRRYPGVHRCLHCGDALVMAEEQGLVVKPGRNGRRR